MQGASRGCGERVRGPIGSMFPLYNRNDISHRLALRNLQLDLQTTVESNRDLPWGEDV